MLNSIDAEQGKEWNRNHARFVHSQMRYRRFSRLTKENRDPVTTACTMTQKRICKTVRQRFQLIERILRRLPIMVLINEGNAPATVGPLVAGVHTNVVVCRDIPSKVRCNTLVRLSF